MLDEVSNHGRDAWMLKAGVDFLNHGSFGALPRAVYDFQDQWRRRIEAEPIELLGRQHPELIETLKQPIGQFLGMSPADFGLVTNATEGVNAVLRSLRFEPGDELLTTSHVYNAVRQAMLWVAQASGAGYREIAVPTPLAGPDEIARGIAAAITPKTKLVVIDHVTSPTGVIFPIQGIARACADRGVPLLVDGAHAPGMIDLNVASAGATYYAGNLHKWACCPKGSAFIWVKPGSGAAIHPCTISHHFGLGLSKEFEWQGTRDASAWLAIPTALDWMASLGWETVRRRNHEMAAWAHGMLVERFKVTPISPLDGSMLGSMATVELPGKLAGRSEPDGRAMQQWIYTHRGIEVPFIFWQGRWHLRVSCQVYNERRQYERLADVILAMVDM